MPQSAEKRAQMWHDYKTLCVQFNVPRNSREWWKHYRELRERQTPRLTPAQLACWWTERLSPEEIRELGGAIDFLSCDRDAA